MKKRFSNVTLLGADHKFERLAKAFEICEHYCDFADKKIITAIDADRITETGIKVFGRKIDSIEAYSHFMVKELNAYVDTEFVLVVQYDGFVLNPDAWSDDFLRYDYVGAPWWYSDGKNVGNGGFSLRSKRLLEILATDQNIVETHPEDHHICRTYGDYLVSKGIRFAPEEVARKFSIEGGLLHPPSGKFGDVWTGEFGFHGHGLQDTDISRWKDVSRFFPKGLLA